MTNSRAKGAAFERQIARDLRLWLENTGDLWRVMRAQTDRQAGQDPNSAGEFAFIGPPGQRFPWAIECKASTAWHESQLWPVPVKGPITTTSKRRGYWEQAVDQASAVGLQPVLVVRRNNGPVLAIMERKTWTGLHVYQLPQMRFRLDVHGQWWDLVAVPWVAVMEANPTEVINPRPERLR